MRSYAPSGHDANVVPTLASSESYFANSAAASSVRPRAYSICARVRSRASASSRKPREKESGGRPGRASGKPVVVAESPSAEMTAAATTATAAAATTPTRRRTRRRADTRRRYLHGNPGSACPAAVARKTRGGRSRRPAPPAGRLEQRAPQPAAEGGGSWGKLGSPTSKSLQFGK